MFLQVFSAKNAFLFLLFMFYHKIDSTQQYLISLNG